METGSVLEELQGGAARQQRGEERETCALAAQLLVADRGVQGRA